MAYQKCTLLYGTPITDHYCMAYLYCTPLYGTPITYLSGSMIIAVFGSDKLTINSFEECSCNKTLRQSVSLISTYIIKCFWSHPTQDWTWFPRTQGIRFWRKTDEIGRFGRKNEIHTFWRETDEIFVKLVMKNCFLSCTNVKLCIFYREDWLI